MLGAGEYKVLVMNILSVAEVKWVDTANISDI